MTIMCAATGCRSRMGDVSEIGEKISFHRFPKIMDLKEKWIDNMGRIGWCPSTYSRLCSLHFEASCYRDGYKRSVLHSDAIPTIFPTLTSTPSMKVPKKRRVEDPNMETYVLPQIVQYDNNGPPKKLNRLSGIGPDAVDEMSTESWFIKKTLRQLEHYKQLAARYELKFKNLQKRYSRVTKNVANLESTIVELNLKLLRSRTNVCTKKSIDADKIQSVIS